MADDLRERIARALSTQTTCDGEAHPSELHYRQADAVLAELASWDTLMTLLDQHWPESVFPTLPDDDRRDPGPRIVSLLRWVDRLTQWKAEALAVLTAWERVWEALRKPGKLGESKAEAALVEVERLLAESADGEVVAVQWGVQTDELGSVDVCESREQAEAERRSYPDGPLPLVRITTEVVSPSGDTTATSPNDDTVPRALYEAEHKRANDSAEKLRETRERAALTERVSVETEPITDAPTMTFHIPPQDAALGQAYHEGYRKGQVDAEEERQERAAAALTDEAIRAEAEARWPIEIANPSVNRDRVIAQNAFEEGARWAREQTAPTVAPDVARIERVILAAEPDPIGMGARRVIAEAVAAADPRRAEAEIKAEALDEAADYAHEQGTPRWDGTEEWLRARAARLRDEADQ